MTYVYNGSMRNESNTTTKVLGTITEKHTEIVSQVFGKTIGKKVKDGDCITFLDILVKNGQFDLTPNDK